MDLSVTLDERMAVYAPVIATVTAAVMKATPKRFDKKRFGPIVSIAIGVAVVVVVDALWQPFVIGEAIVKGLLIATMTSGLYDTAKAGKAIITKTEEE